MAKRRNVIMGLGALAFGSGALSSMAGFSGDISEPEGDFRVLADAQLRVRSARDGSDNPIVTDNNNQSADYSGSTGFNDDDINITDTGYSSDYSQFKSDNLDKLVDNVGSPTALGAEINQGTNDQLAIRLGVSNRIDSETIDPFIEVTNNTQSTYGVAIHYAQSDGSGGISDGTPSSNRGYGSDVYYNSNNDDYTTSDSNTVSRRLVQDVYEWQLDSNGYGTGRNSVGSLNTSPSDAVDGGGTRISPDPTEASTANNPDESKNYAYLDGGQTIFVKLQIDTKGDGDAVTGIPGEINSAAAGGSSTPWSDNDTVDLLDTIKVEAKTP